MIAMGEDTQNQIDVLQSLIKNNQDVQAFWDDLWVKTFNPTEGGGLGDYMFNNVARIFLLIGLVCVAWNITYIAAGNSDPFSGITKVVMVSILILTLSANDSEMTRNLMMGGRQYFNNSRTTMLEARITDISLGGAMKDAFATQASTFNISKEISACEQMPHPNAILPPGGKPTDDEAISKLSVEQLQAFDYVECMKKIPAIIQEELDKNVKATCGDNIASGACAYLIRSLTNQKKTFESGISKELEKVNDGGLFNPFFLQSMTLDFLGGAAARAGEKQLYNTIQYWAASFMELSLFVDALLAPIFIYTGLIPGRLNLILGWVISFFTICVALLVNTAIVGFAAYQMAQTDTYFLSDTRFEFAMGVFAPLMAFAVVGGGGYMAVQSFMGSNLAVIGAATNALGTVSSALTMGLSRAMMQRR